MAPPLPCRGRPVRQLRLHPLPPAPRGRALDLQPGLRPDPRALYGPGQRGPPPALDPGGARRRGRSGAADSPGDAAVPRAGGRPPRPRLYRLRLPGCAQVRLVQPGRGLRRRGWFPRGRRLARPDPVGGSHQYGRLTILHRLPGQQHRPGPQAVLHDCQPLRHRPEHRRLAGGLLELRELDLPPARHAGERRPGQRQPGRQPDRRLLPGGAIGVGLHPGRARRRPGRRLERPLGGLGPALGRFPVGGRHPSPEHRREENQLRE